MEAIQKEKYKILKFPQGLAVGKESEVIEKLKAQALGAKDLVIDMTGVDFISSVVVGTMIKCHQLLVESGGGLHFINVQSNELDDLIGITGLDRVISVCADEAELLQRLETYSAADMERDSNASLRGIDFTIKPMDKNGIRVFYLDGVLTLERDVIDFIEVIDAAIKNGKKKIIIDLANLIYLDSNAIGNIISLYKKIQEIGGTLNLCCPNILMQDLFEANHLTEIIPCYNSNKEAQVSFK